MSVEQTKVIDMMGTREDSKEYVLGISDHLDWEEKNINEHIFLLQEKINAYLSFVESGELLESAPVSKGKKIIIRVIGKYPLPSNEFVGRFFEKATSIVQWAGFDLQFKHEQE